MRLIIYRHLPTTNNLNNIFIGRTDIPCDDSFIENNKEKINSIVSELKFFKELYSSPLLRAQQTANLFVPNAKTIIDKRLIERDLGDWSNISKKLIREKNPEAFSNNNKIKYNYTPANGESFFQVLKRVDDFIRNVYEKQENDDVLIITHNGIINAIKCLKNKANITEKYMEQNFLVPYILEINENDLNDFKSFMNNKKYIELYEN